MYFCRQKKNKDIAMHKKLTLVNQIDEISKLEEFVGDICEQGGIDMSVAMSLNLALEEAVTNVILYAYPEGQAGTIDIIAELTGQQLKFVITDTGQPFDPTAQADADVTLSIEERPIGGLGIFLVRQIMDTVTYQRLDDVNQLTLLKKM